MTQGYPSGESMFVAVMRDHINTKYGKQSKFAENIGMVQSAISSFMVGKTPLEGEKFERIADDMGLAPATLQSLSRISVADAMKMVLENLDQED